MKINTWVGLKIVEKDVELSDITGLAIVNYPTYTRKNTFKAFRKKHFIHINEERFFVSPITFKNIKDTLKGKIKVSNKETVFEHKGFAGLRKATNWNYSIIN